MSITKEGKVKVFEKFGSGKNDTGSAEAQIALFTERIKNLTDHLKTNKKDYSSRRGLLQLVGKRRKLLNYLQKNDIERYRAIISKLELRK
jgi:small subunit ribosomal protein S15